MSVSVSRRNLFRSAGALGALAAIGGLGAGQAAAAPIDGPPTYGGQIPGATWLGTAPDVSDPKISAKVGHYVKTLFPHEGKLYYGYGNYDTNSGSGSGLGTNVSRFDPATGQFEVALQGYNTEEINTFRQIGGKLYTPAVDPFAGNASFASNHFGSWARGTGISGGEHIFDVAGGIDGELFMCGSAGGGSRTIATVWRSVDGGATWSVFFQEAPEADQYRDGFERFYWMGRVGNKLYVKADNGVQFAKRAPMRVLDLVTRKWSTPNAKKIEVGGSMGYAGGPTWRASLGDQVRQGSDVLTLGSELYFKEGYYLYAYDGNSMRRVQSVQQMTLSDTGDLVTVSSGQVHLHRPGHAPALVATGVTGHATLIGSKLYSAFGADFYVRDVELPQAAPAEPAPTKKNNGKGNGKK